MSDRRSFVFWNRWARWFLPDDWDDRRIHRMYVASVGPFLGAGMVFLAVERAWAGAAIMAAGTLYCAWQFKRLR